MSKYNSNYKDLEEPISRSKAMAEIFILGSAVAVLGNNW